MISKQHTCPKVMSKNSTHQWGFSTNFGQCVAYADPGANVKEARLKDTNKENNSEQEHERLHTAGKIGFTKLIQPSH